MNVVHVITTINRGGAENHLQELVAHQLARGYQVTVAYLKGDSYWTGWLQEKGAVVVDLNMSRYGDPSPIFTLREVIRNVNANLVHAHLRPAELYSRLALIGLNAVQLIISKHNDIPFMRIPFSSSVEKWVVKRARRIICISESVRQYMINRTRLPESKLVTVRYGLYPRAYLSVEEDKVKAQREKWGNCKETYFVGAVARMVPQKRLDVLLRGYAEFTHRYSDVNSRLILVGEGPLEDDLRKLAKDLDIAEHIVWEGFRKDIPLVMRSIDVMVLSSQFEGFGLVLLEAMASSKPIIASRISAIPEIVDEGKTGLLFSFGDAKKMAEHIAFFAEKENRKSYGVKGFKRLQMLFTPERMEAETAAVYSLSSVDG